MMINSFWELNNDIILLVMMPLTVEGFPNDVDLIQV